MASGRTLTIVAAMALGALVGSTIFRASRIDRSALQPYESGLLAQAVSGPGVSSNYISKPTIFEGGQRFSYWTGGLSTGERPFSPPTGVAATARQGLVRVEIKTDKRDAGLAARAEAVVRGLDVATRVFWPDEQIPVAVELFQVPEKSRYEFARQITWREGRPFHLTLFIEETVDAQKQADIAVHELYHVLATRWRLGSKGERGIASPWLGLLYEEIAASLLADCGRLKATARLSLPEGDVTFTLPREDGSPTTYKNRLDAQALRFLLDPARSFRFAPGFVTDVMERTILLSFAPNGDSIVTGSGSARQLLALCHTATADPWSLEGWLRRMADH